MKLRKYQHEAIEAILGKFSEGDQRTLCVCATGGGKTIIFAHLAKMFIDKKLGRVLVLTHREELLNQAASKILTITGIKADIEKADKWSTETGFAEHKAPIVIASIQSLVSGKEEKQRMRRFAPNEFALVIQDEAHHCPAKSFTSVVNYFTQNQKLKYLGVTATPDRSDGEAMGQIFQSVAYEYPLPRIIADAYLVPIRQRRVYIDGLDFSTCRTTAGDLNQGDLEEAMTFEAPLHGVAYATIEIACGLEKDSLRNVADDPEESKKFLEVIAQKKPRKTLIFCTSVAHAERMREIIRRWIPESAEVIHGGMLQEDRANVLQQFSNGLPFLCGCMVPTEGFDEPRIELIVMARPTKSRSLYEQMVGRGTRPAIGIAHELGDAESVEDRHAMIAASNKPHLEVLDFVGNSGRHDLVCTADVLGVEYDPAVVEAAREAAVNGNVDMSEALEKAKEDFETKKRKAEARKKKEAEERRVAMEAEAARRAQLRGSATYDVQDVESPGYRTGEGLFFAGDTQIKIDAGETGDNSNKITVAQAVWLRDKGKLKPRYIKEIAKLGRKAAGALQAEIQRGWRDKLRTGSQLMCLHMAGYVKAEWGDWTFERASEEIDYLSQNGWKRRAV